MCSVYQGVAYVNYPGGQSGTGRTNRQVDTEAFFRNFELVCGISIRLRNFESVLSSDIGKDAAH